MSTPNPLESFKNMSIGNFNPMYLAVQACPVLNCPVDWRETPEAHVFSVDLPALSKDDVKIEVDDNRVLWITGSHPAEDNGKDEKDTWHNVERPRGEFVRRFRLPENTKTDDIKAGIKDGVVEIVVGKVEVKKSGETTTKTTKEIEIE